MPVDETHAIPEKGTAKIGRPAGSITEMPALPLKFRKGYSPRELRFRDCYLYSGNATEAYLQAGYKVKDRKYATVRAHRMLKSPRIKALLAPVMNTKMMMPERIIELLSKRAESEPEDEYKWDHWIKILDRLMKYHGMLNDSGTRVSVGTLNLLQNNMGASQLPVQASISDNERDAVVDVHDAATDV